jgi:hypothetical protein
MKSHWRRTGQFGKWVLILDGKEQLSIPAMTQDRLRRRFYNLSVFNRTDPRQFRYW